MARAIFCWTCTSCLVSTNCRSSGDNAGGGGGQGSIPLTGDAQADADIMAFLRARQNILKHCEFGCFLVVLAMPYSVVVSPFILQPSDQIRLFFQLCSSVRSGWQIALGLGWEMPVKTELILCMCLCLSVWVDTHTLLDIVHCSDTSSQTSAHTRSHFQS